MLIRAPRYAAVLLAAATAVTATTATSAALASTVHASHVKTTSNCHPHTKGIGRKASAAQIVRTMRASIPDACGFTVTGELLGADFGIDGVTLVGATTFDGRGHAHVVYVAQGVVLDFYRVGGADYVRLYEYDAPTAVPDLNLRALWSEFGVSSRVVNTAGSTKWVRLTPAQQRGNNLRERQDRPARHGPLCRPAGRPAGRRLRPLVQHLCGHPADSGRGRLGQGQLTWPSQPPGMGSLSDHELCCLCVMMPPVSPLMIVGIAPA
jgi:hypothetical protein